MDEPLRKLAYRHPGEERRRLGTVRGTLCILGLVWFAFSLFGAVMAVVLGDLSDEPGASMTVVNAAVLLALGLPGIALVVAALRLGR